MDHRIELRDRNFDLLEILEKDAYSISWKYNRLGGCGNFSLNLARKYNAPKALSGFFDIRIYKRNSANNYSLWFAGYIEEKEGTLGSKERINISGVGYVGQLRTVIVDTTYTSNEISVIVKDILDNYVVPNTDITYDAGDIEDTGFTADSVEFKGNAMRAFETLAEIAGEREWGVGADKKFFFKQRSDVIGFRFVRGKQIKGYSPVFNFRDIVNKLYLEGGDVGGSKYTRTKTASQSILKYGTLEKIIQNSSITTDSVADQYLTAILDEKSDLDIKAKLKLIDYESRFEDSIPLPLIEIMELGVRYGEDYYGNFLYSGDLAFRINNISYKLDDKGGALGISLDLGTRKTSLVDSIGRLDYRIEQLRQARV